MRIAIVGLCIFGLIMLGCTEKVEKLDPESAVELELTPMPEPPAPPAPRSTSSPSVVERSLGSLAGPAPPVVPPKAVEAQRISGNAQIRPPARVQTAMAESCQKHLIATIKLCLDDAGTVSYVKVLKSSGFSEYDDEILAQSYKWTYKPHQVDGEPAPVCTAVTFIYSQEVADDCLPAQTEEK